MARLSGLDEYSKLTFNGKGIRHIVRNLPTRSSIMVLDDL